MHDEATDYAKRIGVVIDDMYCTLSFAVIGPSKMIQVAIGDSPLYVKTKGEFFHLDGNGGHGEGEYVFRVYDIEHVMDGIGISVGFTEDLQAILMMSDGCLGYGENKGIKDFPSWFYEVIQGRVSIQDTVQKLVDDGYDDCSFSFCVHNFKEIEM